MNNVILRVSARYLAPLLLAVSVVVLVRGHNAPGGGFSGGLLAASAFALYTFAFGSSHARRLLRFDPRTLLAVGVLIAALSGMPSLLGGEAYLSSRWVVPILPVIGPLPLGTPLIFDVGVFIAVIGFTLTIMFVLYEYDEEGEGD
ncbi:MAG: Na+/H+ antiporter subunit B [Bacteroidetes bacterium]|nr:Na+/H+ antiporter subunit B [Bacteroidota bacterium]